MLIAGVCLHPAEVPHITTNLSEVGAVTSPSVNTIPLPAETRLGASPNYQAVRAEPVCPLRL